MGAIAGGVAYVKLSRGAARADFASDEDHFLFGSIGTETRAMAFPTGSGWCCRASFRSTCRARADTRRSASSGKDGHEMPVGLSKVDHRLSSRRHQLRALPYGAVARSGRRSCRRSSPRAPAHQTGAQEYLRFLIACASDPRFTAGTILGEIAKNYRLSLLDRLLYRFVDHSVHAAARCWRSRRDDAWMRQRPDWGRGRTDLFNP